MVRVLASQAAHVQRKSRVRGEGDEEFLGQRRVERAQHDAGHVHGPVQLAAPRYVHGRQHESLVHGKRKRPEPRDAALVAERTRNGLAQHDARVLHGVVRVHLDIAFCAHVEVDQAMPSEGRQHMVEERHARLDVGRTRAVEVHRDADVRLVRRADDFGGSLVHGWPFFIAGPATSARVSVVPEIVGRARTKRAPKEVPVGDTSVRESSTSPRDRAPREAAPYGD